MERDSLGFMLKALSVLVVSSSLMVASVAPAADTAKGAPGAVLLEGVGGKPFWDAVHKGDNAYIARDFDGAIAAYRDAITKEPQNAIGHYRVGEAQIAKGDLKEAEAAFVSGLRFVAANAALKAKLEFAMADLRERQKAYDDATGKWTEYETFTTEQKDAKGFPASATERKKVIEAWKKISVDAAEVKARIDKRVKEADEAMRKSSK